MRSYFIQGIDVSLDMEVATKVLGWSFGEDSICSPGGSCYTPSMEENDFMYWDWFPKCSTRLDWAFLVVEKLQSLDWAFILDNMHHYLGNWQAHFERDKLVYQAESSKSPAHAICLAALKVVQNHRKES